MANHASALKAHRQSVKHRERNRSHRSALRSALKKFTKEIEEGKFQEAKASLPGVYAIVDKSVQKNVLTKNAAARHKSRLSRRLNLAEAKSAGD